jgi:hypothetical protein
MSESLILRALPAAAGGEGMRPSSRAGALSTFRAGSLASFTPAFFRFENVLPIILDRIVEALIDIEDGGR